MQHDSPHSASSKHQGSYSGQAWAHWDYSPEEWAVFDRVDWQNVRLRYWLPNLALLLCISIPGTVFFNVLTPGFIVFGLIVVAVVFLVRAYAYGQARLRHRARQNQSQPQRVTFSRDGVWEAGTYFPFMSLQSVRMTSQPAVLHLRRKHHVYSTQGNGTNQYDTLHVPVPRGHEEEAARLMERFHAMIIERNTPKTYNPPEPV